MTWERQGIPTLWGEGIKDDYAIHRILADRKRGVLTVGR